MNLCQGTSHKDISEKSETMPGNQPHRHVRKKVKLCQGTSEQGVIGSQREIPTIYGGQLNNQNSAARR